MRAFKIFTYTMTVFTVIVFIAYLTWMFVLNETITTEVYNNSYGFIMLLIISGVITGISWEILTRHYGWNLKEAINKSPIITKYLLPSFDELSIFIMSYSFFLLLVVNDNFKNDLNELLFHEFDPRIFFMFLIICIATILSTYHLFTKRKKARIEKWVMLFSVAFVNLLIGLFLAIYSLEHIKEFSIFFVIWNAVNGILLLALIGDGAVDKSALSDWDAPTYMIIISVVIVTIIAILCQYYFDLYWAFSLSITIAYCTTINGFIIKAFQYFSKMKNYDVGSVP